MSRKNNGHFAEHGVLIDKANDLGKPVLEMSLYYMSLEVQMGSRFFLLAADSLSAQEGFSSAPPSPA